MKFSWLSNAPWVSTGYGNQTRLFVPRLKALGHDVVIVAFYGLQGAVINWNGVLCYPGFIDGFGLDVAAPHTHHYGAKVCISLMDAWVIRPEIWIHGVKWVPWFPVDHDPPPPRVVDAVRTAYRRIAYSKFAQARMNDLGLLSYYVPHGVDTQAFYPVPRNEAREKLGFPTDKYLVGMVAANKGNNPSRKAFFPQLEAFAEFHKKHPETALYLHTMRGSNPDEQRAMQSVNLPEYINHLGIKDAVKFPDSYYLSIGYPDEFMRNLYSSFDTFLLTSMGEGFGIPLVEAQACGVPVITGDWTANSELCFSGQRIPREGAENFWTLQGSYQFYPHTAAIYEALEQEYNHPSDREAARNGALAYDADLVTEKYWQPVLKEIEQAVEDED